MRIRRMLFAPLCAVAGALLLAAAPASAATVHQQSHRDTLRGTTTVTTAPGIATTLIHAGVVPLPVPPTQFSVRFSGGLTVSYGFPITGGNPSLSPLAGDIFHVGGIDFVSVRGQHLEIGKFDIALSTGKIYATQVNFAASRIAVLDLNLSHLKVCHHGNATVLTGITLRLDPAAAGALNATFGLALPANGSLVFGTATVVLRG
jgi:hypothetical protein